MSFVKFQKKLYQDLEFAKDRFSVLKSTIEGDLPEGCRFEEYGGAFAIRVTLPVSQHSKFTHLSILATAIQKDHTTKTLETVLYKDKIVYDESIGYDDVRYHEDDFAVLEEIKRLVKII